MAAILVVEDYPPARHLRTRVLADGGFTTVECDSAQAALDRVLAARGALDFVLLDVGLPDGNGIQVCERIRAVRPTLPVVTISAVYCAAHARRAALDAGADAYLLEPTPPARLIATVRRLTSGKKKATPLPDAVIRTTHAGRILWANASAATLLNLSDRALRGRDILPFFNGERGRVQTEIRRAVAGQTGEFEAGLRPRDRAPVGVTVDLTAVWDNGRSELEWLIEPATQNDSTESVPRLQVEPHVVAFEPPVIPHRQCGVRRTAEGHYELRLAIGNVADQRRTYTTPLAAVERAEDWLTRLESIGYRRVRRDTRSSKMGHAPAPHL